MKKNENEYMQRNIFAFASKNGLDTGDMRAIMRLMRRRLSRGGSLLVLSWRQRQRKGR